MIRALLDTNVLVSALLSSAGAPAALVQRWLAGEFEVVVSPRLLEELERTLLHRKFAKWISQDDASEFLALVAGHAELVGDRDVQGLQVRDPLDAFVLALAPDVDVIVSGDSDILSAPSAKPIVTPRAFLDGLAGR